MLSPQFKEEIFNLKMQIEKKERDFRNLQERHFTIQTLLRKLKSTVTQNDQMSKRNHQKWVSINGKIENANIFMKKVFDMQN